MLFEATKIMVICYSRKRKLIQGPSHRGCHMLRGKFYSNWGFPRTGRDGIRGQFDLKKKKNVLLGKRWQRAKTGDRRNQKMIDGFTEGEECRWRGEDQLI